MVKLSSCSSAVKVKPLPNIVLPLKDSKIENRLGLLKTFCSDSSLKIDTSTMRIDLGDNMIGIPGLART